jgi:hypothetical protein
MASSRLYSVPQEFGVHVTLIEPTAEEELSIRAVAIDLVA